MSKNPKSKKEDQRPDALERMDKALKAAIKMPPDPGREKIKEKIKQKQNKKPAK